MDLESHFIYYGNSVFEVEMSLKWAEEEAASPPSWSPSPLGLVPPISLQGIINLAPISSSPASCVTFHLEERKSLQASPPPVFLVFLTSSLPHPL